MKKPADLAVGGLVEKGILLLGEDPGPLLVILFGRDLIQAILLQQGIELLLLGGRQR